MHQVTAWAHTCMSLGDQVENNFSKAEFMSYEVKRRKAMDAAWFPLWLSTSGFNHCKAVFLYSKHQFQSASALQQFCACRWTDISRWVQILVLWLGHFLLYFLRWFSEATSRPRLWMQAFPCSELSAELRNQVDVTAGLIFFFFPRNRLDFVLDCMSVIWRKKKG